MEAMTVTPAKAGKPRKAKAPQPLEAINSPDALLALPTVSALTDLRKSALYEKARKGTFPQPLKLGARCTRWRAGDVMEWLKAPR